LIRFYDKYFSKPTGSSFFIIPVSYDYNLYKNN